MALKLLLLLIWYINWSAAAHNAFINYHIVYPKHTLFLTSNLHQFFNNRILKTKKTNVSDTHTKNIFIWFYNIWTGQHEIRKVFVLFLYISFVFVARAAQITECSETKWNRLRDHIISDDDDDDDGRSRIGLDFLSNSFVVGANRIARLQLNISPVFGLQLTPKCSGCSPTVFVIFLSFWPILVPQSTL